MFVLLHIHVERLVHFSGVLYVFLLLKFKHIVKCVSTTVQLFSLLPVPVSTRTRDVDLHLGA